MQKLFIAGAVGRDIDPDTLRAILSYDPETGLLTWRARSNPNFDSRFAGREAFTALKDGYRVGAVFNRSMRAHRVIFAIVAGRWPEGQIDHINGVRDDNRWANLREVSVSENQRNTAISKNNTSGCSGVYWDKRRGKWTAQMSRNFRNYYLGAFEDRFDAIMARLTAEKSHGYHINNGRAA